MDIALLASCFNQIKRKCLFTCSAASFFLFQRKILSKICFKNSDKIRVTYCASSHKKFPFVIDAEIFFIFKFLCSSKYSSIRKFICSFWQSVNSLHSINKTYGLLLTFPTAWLPRLRGGILRKREKMSNF